MYFRRRENLTWEQLYFAANAEYKSNQQKELDRLAQRERLANEAREAARHLKEEAERVRLEKEAAEKCKREEEEERKREEQRKKEEAERQLKLQKEKAAAAEARKEVASFILGDLIELSDEEDDSDKRKDKKKENNDLKMPTDEVKIKQEPNLPSNDPPSPSKSPSKDVDNNKNEEEEKKENELIDASKIEREKDETVNDDQIIPNKNLDNEKNEENALNTENVMMHTDDLPKGDNVVVGDTKERNPKAGTSDFDYDTTIAEIGGLIADPDVLYALRHLKSIGKVLRIQDTVPGRRGALFQENTGNVNVKQEPDMSSKLFTSPPKGGQRFLGMKRHTPQSFLYPGNTKKKRTGTPGRSNFGGSPSSTPYRPDICVAQADNKAKCAAQCDQFIKRKKLTNTNKSLVYQHVQKKGLEIIDYDTKPQRYIWQYCVVYENLQ